MPDESGPDFGTFKDPHTDSSEPASVTTTAKMSQAFDPSEVHPNTVRSLATDPPQLNPANKNFMRFYYMSSSLPIIATATGPLANLCNLVSICDHWRVSTITGESGPRDASYVLGLNAVSLFLSCISNVSLFLNFTGTVNYNLSQAVSIGGWYLSSCILTGLLVRTHIASNYFGAGSEWTPAEAYWHAVIACALNFVGASMLLVNEMGHVLGHYPASFNLTATQRRIMLLNVLCIVHIAVGGAIFQKVMDISYADAVYFSLVTILTVGFGDITPKSTLGRALVIPYVYVGVVLFGFTIASISVSVLEAHGQTVYFYRLEHGRLRELSSDRIDQVDDRQAFEIIKEVHRREKRRGTWIRSGAGLLTFAAFWLVGALVFSEIESWTYFEAIYFTTFCFVTTGYGDFAPSTAGGRPFFILWAIAAVPMMTIFISSVADAIQAKLLASSDRIVRWSYEVYAYFWHLCDLFRILAHQNAAARRDKACAQAVAQTESEDVMTFAASARKIDVDNRLERILLLLKGVEQFTETLVNDPDTRYTYEDWDLLRKIIKFTHRVGGAKAAPHMEAALTHPHFWLSEQSPLRFPIVEPRFFLLSTLTALESEVRALAEKEDPGASAKFDFNGAKYIPTSDGPNHDERPLPGPSNR